MEAYQSREPPQASFAGNSSNCRSLVPVRNEEFCAPQRHTHWSLRSFPKVKQLFASIMRLGAGEAVARLSSFAIYAFISRKYGLELVATLTLAQTVATYVSMGADQGLRLIGARLVARDPNCSRLVVDLVLRRRLVSCSVCVVLGCLYALWAPLPDNARYCVLGFVLGVIPYAFSLDWLAWGLNRIGWLGTCRASMGLLFAITAIVGMQLSGKRVLVLTIANGFTAMGGAALLWFAWRRSWQHELQPAADYDPALAARLGWGLVLPLGMATMLTLVFNSFDTVMLAAMSTVNELGRYSAAYKILFVIFGAYYLFTQSLYPKLSSLQTGTRARQLLPVMVAVVGLVGILIAIVLAVWPERILRFVYGNDFNAGGLLRVLSMAIPMDFCAALMGILLVSRGLDRAVLKCAGGAALCNILINLWLIPRRGAVGAAWSTVISYLVLVASLAIVAFRPSVFLDDAVAALQAEALETRA
jgi:O-antigen/teichoic acid export membrane protein